MDFAIDVRNLIKTYPGRPPVEAVRGIDLRVPMGECYGVLGPNGAGKTTTIEILEGLMPATSGEVRLLGLTWKQDAHSIRQKIGVSLQESKQSDKLSVRETVRLFRSFYASGTCVERVIEQVGLMDKAKAWAKNLSGGQRQRLAIACAIIGNPQLLFLDEPTTGLDPTNRRQLWEIIRRFRESGHTILMTTHYMEEAERLCDRVAIIDHGRIIAEGSPRELIASLGADHVIEFQVDDPQMQLNSLEISALPSVQLVESDRTGYRISVGQPHEVLPELMRLVARHQLQLTGLATRNATLEDVFIHLTGRHLNDDIGPNTGPGDGQIRGVDHSETGFAAEPISSAAAPLTSNRSQDVRSTKELKGTQFNDE